MEFDRPLESLRGEAVAPLAILDEGEKGAARLLGEDERDEGDEEREILGTDWRR